MPRAINRPFLVDNIKEPGGHTPAERLTGLRAFMFDRLKDARIITMAEDSHEPKKPVVNPTIVGGIFVVMIMFSVLIGGLYLYTAHVN